MRWIDFYRWFRKNFLGGWEYAKSRYPLNLITHRDRSSKQENRLWRAGNSVPRKAGTEFDIFAGDVNANVFTCVRAITEAISLLPINVVGVEIVNGKEMYYDDNDHPANQIIINPNPRDSIGDLKRHCVKSYLLDGNSYLSIEKPGRNKIEIWPRNPRAVRSVSDDTGAPGGYRVGMDDSNSVFYPWNRMIHIKDPDPTNPHYGKSRIEAVRVEIMMDSMVNKFNNIFFQSGATLGMMFTPEHDLTEEQHEQLLAAFNSEAAGVDNAFTTFINRFAGKLESPDQKHKDIAFLGLLEHNREKIFSQFGLPPFRGGVMEWANYANALAQDLDFWNNTVLPITNVIEDGLNNQLMRIYFGEDFKFKFSFEGISALKGNPKEQAEVHKIYVDTGIKTIDEVRAEMNMKPIPEKDEEKDIEPLDEDKKEVGNAIHKIFKMQQNSIIKSVSKYCVDGTFMSRFFDAEVEAKQFFNLKIENDRLKQACFPIFNQIIRTRGNARFDINKISGVFDPDCKDAETILIMAGMKLEETNYQTFKLLKSCLNDCKLYNWDLYKLLKSIKSIFTRVRAGKIADNSVIEIAQSTEVLVYAQIKNLSNTYINDIIGD